MIITPDLLIRVLDSAAGALEQLRWSPIHLLTEADLQSHLFMALFNGLRHDLDSDRIGLHCQPRFSLRRMIDLENDIQTCVFSIAVTIFLPQVLVL